MGRVSLFIVKKGWRPVGRASQPRPPMSTGADISHCDAQLPHILAGLSLRDRGVAACVSRSWRDTTLALPMGEVLEQPANIGALDDDGVFNTDGTLYAVSCRVVSDDVAGVCVWGSKWHHLSVLRTAMHFPRFRFYGDRLLVTGTNARGPITCRAYDVRTGEMLFDATLAVPDDCGWSDDVYLCPTPGDEDVFGAKIAVHYANDDHIYVYYVASRTDGIVPVSESFDIGDVTAAPGFFHKIEWEGSGGEVCVHTVGRRRRRLGPVYT